MCGSQWCQCYQKEYGTLVSSDCHSLKMISLCLWINHLMIVPFLAIFSSNIYDEDMKQGSAKEKAK